MSDFTTAPPPENEDSERQAEGIAFWHDALAGVGDAESRARIQMTFYRGCKIKAFRRSGRSKTYEAHEITGGRGRKNPDDRAGPVGRLIVREGLPLPTYDIDFALIPELAHRVFDPSAEFDSEALDIAQAWYERNSIKGSGYVLRVQQGKKNGRNHIHVMAPEGACRFGRKTANNTPERVLKALRYLSDKPRYTLKNLVGYIEAVRRQGNPAHGLRYGRLSSEPITVADVEAVMKCSLLRQGKSKSKRVLPIVENSVIAQEQTLSATENNHQSGIVMGVRHCGQRPVRSIRIWTSRGLVDLPDPVRLTKRLLKNPRQRARVLLPQPVVTRPEIDIAEVLKELHRIGPDLLFGEPEV